MGTINAVGLHPTYGGAVPVGANSFAQQTAGLPPLGATGNFTVGANSFAKNAVPVLAVETAPTARWPTAATHRSFAVVPWPLEA